MKQTLGELEFRLNGDGRDPEIVKKIKMEDGANSCYTLLFWRKDKEGYSIETVGGRIFDEGVDSAELMKLMKFGQKVLEAKFDLEN